MQREITSDGLVQVFGTVTVGGNVTIMGPCILGMPYGGMDESDAHLHIPDSSIIRPFTTIYASVTLGPRFQSGQGSVVREHNVLGEDVCLGSNSVLEPHNTLGSHIRIQACCSMGTCTIGDWVFIGNVVAITDTPHPMRCPHLPCPIGGTTIKDYARIGGGVTLCPGVTVGTNAFVGAGAVVTRDVPDDMLAVGNPARPVKRVDELTCDAGFYEHPYGWEPYLSR